MKFYCFATFFLILSAHAQSSVSKIVFFGDSLTAGYGMDEFDAYPVLVEKHLKAAGKNVECINAGTTGDTTTSALKRLDWVLKQKPTHIVIALGANDMMRGVPTKSTEKNLREIIQKARASKAEPILFGMKAFPSMGQRFKKEFDAVFKLVARTEKVKFLEFFLIGVAGDPKLNLADGIHPTAEGHVKIAKTVGKFLEKALP